MDAKEKHYREYDKINDRLIQEEEALDRVWKLARQNGFTDELCEEILFHCNRGQVHYEAFYNWKMEGRKLYRGRFFPLPNDSRFFNAAVQVYEKQKRFSEALDLCEKALEYFKENKWYLKKIDYLKKKLSTNN